MGAVKIVEAELIGDLPAVVPKQFQIFVDEVPKKKEDCFTLIKSNLIDAARYATLRHWNVGRVIDTLKDRGEKDVLTQVMEKTQYEKRHLQYTLSVFRKFPSFEEVHDLCVKGLEWTQFKMLTAVKEDGDREEIVEKIMEDRIDKYDLGDEIKKANSSGLPALPALPEVPETDGTIETAEPLKFFQKMHDALEKTYHHFTDKLMESKDYLDVATDDMRTTDEVYNKVIEQIAVIRNDTADCQDTLMSLLEFCDTTAKDHAEE